MKKFCYLCVLLSASAWADIACIPVQIMDGDTFICRTQQNERIKVRMNGIDAPERGQAYANQAKKALNKLIYKKSVLLVENGKDKYNRTLATVFLSSNTGKLNVNLKMIENGYAWHYERYSNNRQYAWAQRLAQSEKRGLWADKGKIIEPEKWRHQHPSYQSQ